MLSGGIAFSSLCSIELLAGSLKNDYELYNWLPNDVTMNGFYNYIYIPLAILLTFHQKTAVVGAALELLSGTLILKLPFIIVKVGV